MRELRAQLHADEGGPLAPGGCDESGSVEWVTFSGLIPRAESGRADKGMAAPARTPESASAEENSGARDLKDLRKSRRFPLELVCCFCGSEFSLLRAVTSLLGGDVLDDAAGSASDTTICRGNSGIDLILLD
jgi:hypothetical protein